MIKRIFRGVAAVLICALALGALTSAMQLIGNGIAWSGKSDEPEKLYPTGAEHLKAIEKYRVAHLSYESGAPAFVVDKSGQVTLPDSSSEYFSNGFRYYPDVSIDKNGYVHGLPIAANAGFETHLNVTVGGVDSSLYVYRTVFSVAGGKDISDFDLMFYIMNNTAKKTTLKFARYRQTDEFPVSNFEGGAKAEDGKHYVNSFDIRNDPLYKQDGTIEVIVFYDIYSGLCSVLVNGQQFWYGDSGLKATTSGDTYSFRMSLFPESESNNFRLMEQELYRPSRGVSYTAAVYRINDWLKECGYSPLSFEQFKDY